MSPRRVRPSQVLLAGFPALLPEGVYRSRIPYLAAYNGPSSLLHAVEVLHAQGISLCRARILPDIGRVTEPEVRLYRVERFLDGLPPLDTEEQPIEVVVNVREDNRLHRFLPLLAVGLPPRTALRGWAQGRSAPHAPFDEEQPPPPLTPLQGYHQYYLEPGATPYEWTNRVTLPQAEREALEARFQGAMPADWTNQITPAERLALQICTRFRSLRDPGVPPLQIADRMLIVAGSIFEERDDPLAGVVLSRQGSLISQIGSVLDLVEVFLSQAMLTIAGGDALGGFEYVLPFEPPDGRDFPLMLDEGADAEMIARWFNAYPHRRIASSEERHDPRLAKTTGPTRWSANDPGIQKVQERIATWYLNGSVKQDPWTPDSAALKYKLTGELLKTEDMLSLARAYLPEFLPDYPRQVFVSGGMNLEGILLGLIQHWLQQGSFLGMDYEDWDLFSMEEQVMLCGLLVQRNRQLDQCAAFEAAVRLLIDEGIKTWLEMYRPEKIGLDSAKRPSPLAQLGRCLPLGGRASLHAPSMMVRIPRDYTRDPEALHLERKLNILEDLFLPAHIPARHIWEIDWVKLGTTAYLKPVLNPINPDLIPVGVRLYDGSN